ncbi:hypothetical protein HaLaN_00205, partial [Haematococcus lacustris]
YGKTDSPSSSSEDHTSKTLQELTTSRPIARPDMLPGADNTAAAPIVPHTSIAASSSAAAFASARAGQ